MIYVLGFLGLIMGSFSSVLMEEFSSAVEGGDFDLKRVLFGRSRCPECKKDLSWYNLLPVLSFLLQRGKCTSCGTKLSYKYLLLELIMGGLFMFCFSFFGLDILELFLSLLVVFLGINILTIDLKTLRIPSVLSYSLVVVGAMFGYFVSDLGIWDILLGGLLGYLFFFLQHFVSKGKWVGLGDADLGLAIGFMFGPWVGLYTILQSYVLGTVVLVPVMLLDKAEYGMKSQVPFGPFLVVSLIFSMFFGSMIVEWYVNSFII